MSAPAVLLPEGFEGLAEFSGWILPTEQARNTRRLASSMQELQSFYDAMHRHLPQIAASFANTSLAALSAAQNNLLLLTLSLMEVSACIELFSSARVPFAVPAERLRILQ